MGAGGGNSLGVWRSSRPGIKAGARKGCWGSGADLCPPRLGLHPDGDPRRILSRAVTWTWLTCILAAVELRAEPEAGLDWAAGFAWFLLSLERGRLSCYESVSCL